MEENKKELREKVTKETEKKIEEVLEQGLEIGNVDLLYTLVDIHKDIANEEYWEKKEETMRYGNYGAGRGGSYNGYGAGRGGSYNEGGSYGRRGVKGSGRGRYRGEEMMDEMYEGYQGYSEGKERYERGSYGAKEDTMKSLEYMLESMVGFVEMLKQDANSQEEVQLIKEYTRRIADM